MNQDPNQPVEQPQAPAENPTPAQETPIENVATPVTPTEVPVVPAPEPAVNPFGGPAVTPAANPFSGAPISSNAAAPVQPTALGSAPVASPVAAPAPSKKKLIILLSAIIGGLLVLGGAALAIYLIFFTVSKADYQKAYDQVSVVADAASSSGVSFSASTDTVTKAAESYQTFKTENAKLSSLNAFRGDKELKQKYEAYNTKAKAFIAFADTYIPSLQALSAASKEVTGANGAATFSSATIQKTIDVYKKADITEPSLKKFINATIATYEEILPQVKIYESTSSTSAQKLAASKAMSTTLKGLSTSSSALSTELKEKTDAVKFTDELNALGKATTAKLNDAK